MMELVGLKLSAYIVTLWPGNTPSRANKTSNTRTTKHFELVLFLGDAGCTIINDKKHEITAGTIRFLRPGDKVYSDYFPQALILYFDADDKELAKKAFEFVPPIIQSSDIEKDTVLLKNLLLAHSTRDHLECSICLWRFLRRLKETCQMQKSTKNASTIFQIRDYIDENYYLHLTLDDLSSKFHINPDYLQRKFKKKFGQSPAEYQLDARLTQAVALLCTSNQSVEEIAELCGFSSSSHFIRAFKSKKNMTPSQFRRDYFSTIRFS